MALIMQFAISVCVCLLAIHTLREFSVDACIVLLRAQTILCGGFENIKEMEDMHFLTDFFFC